MTRQSLPAALVAAVVCAALGQGVAPSVASAFDVQATYDFADELVPSYATPGGGGALTATPGASFRTDPALPGPGGVAGRRVLHVPGPDAVTGPDRGGLADYSTQLTFDLDTPDPDPGTTGTRVEVLRVDDAGTGVQVLDGELIWHEEGADEVDTSFGAPALEGGDWPTVYVSRVSDYAMRLFARVGGTRYGPVTVTRTDPGTPLATTDVLLGGDVAGDIARYRVLTDYGPLAGWEVDALRDIDTTAPVGTVGFAGQLDAQNRRWSANRGRISFFDMTDDGTSPLSVAWRLLPSPTWTTATASVSEESEGEELKSSFLQDLDFSALPEDVEHTMEIRVGDRAGNTTTQTRTFRVDRTAPKPTVEEPPARTPDRTPAPAGRVTLNDRDIPLVYAQLWRGDSAPVDADAECAGDLFTCHGRFVGFYQDTRLSNVTDDGRWDLLYVPLRRTQPDSTTVQVGPLADGTYTLRAGAMDILNNQSTVDHVFRVGEDERPPPERPGTPAPQRIEVPVPVLVPGPPAAPAPPAPPTMSDVVARLLTAARERLERQTLFSLARGGVVKVPCAVPVPGTCVVQVFGTRKAPAKVVPTAVAAGRRTQRGLLAAGRVTVPGGLGRVVTVRASRRARTAMRRRSRDQKVAVRAIFIPRGGTRVTRDGTARLRR